MHLSVTEAAEMLGVTRAAVHYLIRVGAIAAQRIGKQYVIHIEEARRLKNDAAWRNRRRLRGRGVRAKTAPRPDACASFAR